MEDDRLSAALRPVADVLELAGEAAAALGTVTVVAASRWLHPAHAGPGVRTVSSVRTVPPRADRRLPPRGRGGLRIVPDPRR